MKKKLEEEKALEEGEEEEIWFKMEPPIVGLVCSGEACAVKFMNLARGSAGIKRCSVISIREQGLGYVLSLSDTRKIETLVCVNRKMICSKEYLEILVKSANKKLRESRERFERLRLAIEKSVVFDVEEEGGND